MILYVRDYVRPNAADDTSEGIRRALADAKRLGADELHFEKGVYYLSKPIRCQTDQSGHDAGAARSDNKEVLILLEGFSHFTLSGETDGNGEPATTLAGMNTLELHSIQPAVLWCERCDALTVKNLRFTRTPEFCSAGTVESVTDDTIRVKVSDGNPCYDGMGTYCINKFTPDGKTLDGVSLSYGPGLGTTFRLVGERLLELKDKKTADAVKPGDMLSWHQGAKTDFQCYFGSSKDLSLSNLRTVNSNGFAMIAFDVCGLTADRVVFKPEGNQLFTAPRDAWKLHKCSGQIEISRFYVEGVRMDGQNVHNNYLFVREKVSDRELVIESENARTDFRSGSAAEGEIEFFRDEKPAGKALLSRYEYLSSETVGGRNINRYRFFFDESLNFPVDGETLALADCFAPALYHCHDSEFRNVAGAGHLLRIAHVRIENCRYTNMMNAGVMLGAEFPTHHEGGNCSDAVIEGCTFDNCGFYPRYGTIGCVGINSAGFHTQVNHDITVKNCTFRNSSVGVDIHKAHHVRVTGCTYENIDTEVLLNE